MYDTRDTRNLNRNNEKQQCPNGKKEFYNNNDLPRPIIWPLG